jgi:hypothetical protein
MLKQGDKHGLWQQEKRVTDHEITVNESVEKESAVEEAWFVGRKESNLKRSNCSGV